MKVFLSTGLLFFSLLVRAQADGDILKGNQYYEQAQFDLAEAHYRDALEVEPDNTTALYNLSNALQKQKKYDEAAGLLERLAKLTKDVHLRSTAYYNQGVAYSKSRNLGGSIESYKKSLRLNPDDSDARENLEKALLELKKQQQQKQKDQKMQEPKMSQKEAEQKLKLLEQKEKELHQRKQQKQGSGQAKDW